MSRGPYSEEKAAYKFAGERILRFYTVSIGRISALVEHSQTLSAKGEDHSSEIGSDILRAAAVLLHATLEDFLRSVESGLRPLCGEKALENVPLVGLKTPKKENAKLHLGRLAAHRGKLVDDVIQESVDEDLLERTYSDTTKIATLLKTLEINQDTVKTLYPELDKLIRRRHQIVHRGDEQGGKLEPISPEQVEKWIIAVADFVGDICVEISELPSPKRAHE